MSTLLHLMTSNPQTLMMIHDVSIGRWIWYDRAYRFFLHTHMITHRHTHCIKTSYLMLLLYKHLLSEYTAYF